MSAISIPSKRRLGFRAAKFAVKKPALLRLGARAGSGAAKVGFKLSKPVVKRRARHRAQRIGGAARTIGETLVVYGPQAAYELGLAEPPKEKRTGPRVAAGVVIGAGAMYFLEPGHGREHRQKVAQLVS